MRVIQYIPVATPIPAAATYTHPTFGLRNPIQLGMSVVTTSAAAGTSTKFYLQTSVDFGVTFFDIMSIAFTTGTVTKVGVCNFGITPGTNPITTADGSLSDGTYNQGILGTVFRVKNIVVGSYTGTYSVSIFYQPD